MSAKDNIKELLSSDPQTVADFATAAEVSESTARKALGELVEAGEAEKVEVEDQPTGFRTPTRKRANHGYARNHKGGSQDADARDEAVLAFIDESGPSTKQELADGLSITKRAVSHAVWRLMGKPNKGSTSAPVILEQVTRGTYARVEAEAS